MDADRRGYSASLIRKCHQRLSSSLQLAKRWGWIAENPCEVATVPKMTPEGARGLDARWRPPTSWPWRRPTACTRIGHSRWRPGPAPPNCSGWGGSDLDVERGTITIGRRAVRLLRGPHPQRRGQDGGRAADDPPDRGHGRRTARASRAATARRGVAPEWVDNDLIFSDGVRSPGQPVPCPARLRPPGCAGRGQAHHPAWDAQEPHHGTHCRRRERQSRRRAGRPSRHHYDARPTPPSPRRCKTSCIRWSRASVPPHSRRGSTPRVRPRVWRKLRDKRRDGASCDVRERDQPVEARLLISRPRTKHSGTADHAWSLGSGIP